MFPVDKYISLDYSCYTLTKRMSEDPLVQKATSIILTYLPRKAYRMFLFGSRTRAHHHPYSDIDIGLDGTKRVVPSVMAQIVDALEESDLPVNVDVVDFSRVTPEFAQIARQNLQPI